MTKDSIREREREKRSKDVTFAVVSEARLLTKGLYIEREEKGEKVRKRRRDQSSLFPQTKSFTYIQERQNERKQRDKEKEEEKELYTYLCHGPKRCILCLLYDN